MNWEAIGSIGELIGAVAVVFSLLYLGVQIRHSSNSSRASAITTLLTQYDSPNYVMAGNKESARVFRLGLDSIDQLDDDERFQFQVIMVQFFTVYHTAFHFHKDKILSEEQWGVFRRDLVEFTDYPGIKMMMPYHKAYYSPDPGFLRELQNIEAEHIDEPATTTFAEVLRAPDG